MGKLIEFKTKRVGPPLTDDESKACDIAKSLKDAFSQDEVDSIKRELEEEDDES